MSVAGTGHKLKCGTNKEFGPDDGDGGISENSYN